MQAGLIALQWVLLLLLVGAVVALVSLPFRRRRRSTPSTTGTDTPEWWRCNVCGLRWRARGVTSVRTIGLRIRRSARRRARAAGRATPEWAAPRGTERCPSCLSRSIRPSRQQSR